ncbi:LOW QUALITY PROTEIN: acyl-CoA desaturase-like [Apis dorsata]|uniref:LOW QUALITY PROTEIN: acyl-CoA desaturase-like n=1 Tax=Apis dorsata TaxID=7462 RepID=UPI00129341E3|nr:LOW QUALITY PROTEIN: acyl-CoA desaturase-like [Apis dorsata]
MAEKEKPKKQVRYTTEYYIRIHHKYYGTDKDLYNHKKGILYSHFISNVLSPNVSLEETKRNIDLRDIDNNVYIYFQKIFYWPLFLIFGLIILFLNAPLEYWDESMIETILIKGFLRFAITINISWLVNNAYLV